MDAEDLEALLSDLRATRNDHRTVEAKAARDSLPADLWTSVSALCNSEGGTLLLGVLGTRRDFLVVGVADPGRTTTDLRSVCDSLEPPPRPVITTVHHPDGEVVVAQFTPTPRHQRPCHLARLGPRIGSYRRVGDGDIALSEDEVAEMQAAASHLDHSNTPAAHGCALDRTAIASFLALVRDPRDDFSDEQLLHRWNVAHDGVPTLAGVLTLGDGPDATEPAAQVLIERMPSASAPVRTEFSLDRRRGTIGQLLDDVLNAVTKYLPVVKIAEPSGLVDDSDVPRLALRELISNALIHRSFSPAMQRREVRVEITDDSITIISPGCLSADVDAARLGLDRLAPARNHALVRVAEQLTTPSGRRIVEHAASGIPRADAACRRRGTLPALFTDSPTEFHATLVRRRVDDARAEALLGSFGVAAHPDLIRLVAAIARLSDERAAAAGHPLAHQAFDARFATRVLAPAREELVMAHLARLEEAGILRRRALRRASNWELVPAQAERTAPEPLSHAFDPPRPAGRKQRKGLGDDVLRALLAADDHQLRPVQMRELFSISSPNTLNDVLTDLADKALIESTEANPRHPRKAFRLTRSGVTAATRLRS